MGKNKIYFDNLDSIRFIAAMMVFLQHGMSASYKYLPVKDTFWDHLLNVVSNGGTGVSIFFVLSGFLITYLLISEYELKSRVEISNFYIRRILRIWPLYFAVVFFSFLLYPFLKKMIGMNNPLGSNIIYHLLFLSNFDVIHVQTFCPGKDAMSQGITWSVSIEEQFYLFWPLIFTFLPRRLWVYAILLVITVSLLFRMNHMQNSSVIYFHTLSVLVDSGIGGLMAYLIKKYTVVKTFFENSSTKTHGLFFIVTIILLLYGSKIFQYPYSTALNRSIISVSFALVIASQALTNRNSILNLKNLTFANKWGKYTYGIYLIHPIAITLLDVTLRIGHISRENFFRSFSFGLASFILTLIMSKLSYDYYESRFIRLKDKFAVIKTHK